MNILYNVVIPALTSTVVVGLWYLILQKVISGKVYFHFNRKLEDHRHDLTTISESLKYDYQRKLEDFNLFTTKKHAIYMKLYELIHIAFGKVGNLTSSRPILTLEDRDKTDIEMYMDVYNFPNKIKSRILNMWDTNQASAIGIIRKYKRLFEIQDARFAIMEARNYSITNKLYLSDSVFDKISNAAGKMISLHSIHTHPDVDQGSKGGSRISTLKEEISVLVEEITKIMRYEISIGYYNENDPIN
ncbi:hypothetical protein K8T06_02375 [bacterium]|nr:hypothetical protein [bacterium]